MPRAPFLLYVGDALAIFLFAVVGRQSHDLAATNASGLAASFMVAAPFIAGWLIVAPWFRAFHPPAWASPRSAVLVVLKAFLPAYLAGVALRTLFLGRLSPLVFYLVTAAVILVFLLGWRLLYTTVVAPRIARS